MDSWGTKIAYRRERIRVFFMMGDFNSALNIEDSSMGTSSCSTGMREFQACVDDIEVVDINRSGIHFTWNQKPKKGVGLLKKIDRVMGNTSFLAEYLNSVAIFKPYRLSDHCPCILSFPDAMKMKSRSFKFANFLVFKPEFLEIVTKCWDTHVDGVHQFRVVKKLRLLKNPLRSLLFKQGNLHKKVDSLRLMLDAIQQKMDQDPSNVAIRDDEASTCRELQAALLDEERFLKQKSKVDWLAAGDMNTAFFHSSLKARNHFSRIEVVTDSGGISYEGDMVYKAFVQHYESVQYGSAVNHTILALVPKVDTPNSVLDYRPISCCNVIYKCISKIITDRLKGSLDTLVSINQSAFVPGRKITDNILLTQELMHNYHLNKGQPRCAFKIDIQKAYDTVSWSFLESILKKFGFHHKMINWIMTCVTSVSYSLSINGELHGYFEGKRGLRQGDPMSPYLFTLVMEVLTLILQQVATNTSFKFHGKCSKQKIINILFADDLFLFSHGDSVSVKHLKLALDKFTQISGLVPSMPKSTVYFSNVTSAMKNQILNLLPFQEGSLPVRYLGVPLISTRLAARDCKILIERTQRRIDNWVTKSLSFAGRLQLINSVLAAMYSYWASVFLLPIGIVKDLEKRLRRFLWNGGNQGPVRAKVAWKEVCTPKDEGGLGIRSIMDANKAFLTTHIWSIITNRPSLWVQWIHSYRLKGNNFWEVQCRGQVSWGWRKLLAIRPSIRPFVWSSIYSGRQTNVWSDNWCAYSPLRSFISPRNIARAGFSLSTTVADVVSEDGQWRWPQAWYDTFPVLINIATIQITPDTADRFRWKDWEGKLQRFCSWEAWNNLRYKENKVVWVSSVWFSQCIPRHSFHLWLVIKNKLRTQDRMAEWEAGSATNLRLMCCPLCRYDRDSRDHLFFECSYASEVWRLVRNMVDMGSVDDTWASVMQWMELNANSSSLDYIVCNLLLAASTYFIWQERNNRLFTQVQRNASVLSKVIIDTIRLRIMGFKTGRDPKQRKLLDRWLIAKTNMDVDPG
ncbi:uncharacterized protein LOC110931611 [Helianthus annuus]|uniref:uncharacterized protein LOC110931611 n=1 Tax=Helianthus annuus TaxID=4232 RepID=UPI000B8FC957|nr:uncharacterized protein LOC110931611 [Helianthus annuus]